MKNKMRIHHTMENNIVKDAQSGDHPAFENLYRSNVNRIYALALRLSGEKRKAEELTQDVFVRVWQKLSQFKGESSFYTWLYRLAINLIISQLKSDRLRYSFEMTSEVMDTTLGSSDQISLDGKMDLEAAIQSLPNGARTVLVLHDVEGFRHSEIGEMLKISDGTSKAQLFRARRILKEVLKNDMPADQKYIR